MHMTPEEAAFLALLDMLEKILPLLGRVDPMLNLQRTAVVRVVRVPAVLGVRVAEHPGGLASGATVFVGAYTWLPWARCLRDACRGRILASAGARVHATSLMRRCRCCAGQRMR